MDIINYKIIECDRLSSQDVKILGIDADNKSSWRNIIKPIQLKKGDQINLEQCIISQKGANSESIEFNGENQKGLRDNFSLLQIGFYLNNNGIHTLGLPFCDKDDIDGKRTTFNTDTFTPHSGGYNVPSAFQGKADYQHPLPSDDYANTDIDLDKIISINPYQYIDSSKYAKLDPNYAGWDRDSETGRRPSGFPQCNLMLEDIPLNLKGGFLNPSSVADKLTLQLQRTLPAKDDIKTPNVNNGYDTEIINDLQHPFPFLFNSNEGGVPHNQKELLYAFNGYCYKSIRCNFGVKDSGTLNYDNDPIYGNLCVSNPYKYVYGVRLIQDTDIYPQNTLQQEPDGYDTLMGTDTDILQVNMRVFYPLFFFSNFKFNSLTDLDIINWDNYSPKSFHIESDVGTENILTLTTTLNYSDTIDYDRIYFIPITINTANVRYLVEENGELIVRADANIINDLGNDGRPIYYINDLPARYNLFIIWNATPTLDKCDVWISEINNVEIELHNVNFVDYYQNGVITITNNVLNFNWFLSFEDKEFTHGRIMNTPRRADGNNLHIANFTLDNNYTINITTITNNYDLPNVGIAPLDGALWQSFTNPLEFYDFKQFPTFQNFTITWLNPNLQIEYDFSIEARAGTPALAVGKYFCKFNHRNKNDYEKDEDGLIIYTGTWYSENNQYVNPPLENIPEKGIGTFILKNMLISLTDNSTFPFTAKFIHNGILYNFRNHTIKPNNTNNIIPTGWTLINNSNTVGINTGNALIYTKFKHLTKNQVLPSSYGDGTFSAVGDGNYNLSNGDVATTKLDGAKTLSKTRARFQKNQLLITNIKFTLENIKIIADWMKYNKIYDGVKTNKTDINNDTENYYINVDIGRTSDSQISKEDQFNVFPLVPPYMKDKGRMGIDDEGGVNFGNTSVRAKADFQTRQEIKVRTSFFNDYYDETKIFYGGVIQDQYPEQINQNAYAYGELVIKDDPRIKNLIDYLKENNIGIIPLNNGGNIVQPFNTTTDYTCGFLVYDNYVRGELLKIQNLTYFGFSPMFQDCPQVVPMSINQSPNYSSTTPSNGVNNTQNMATTINIGAVNPTLRYNTNFSQYQISEFHTPMYQNELNSSADDAGKIVARLQDQTVNFTSYFQNRAKFDGSALKGGNPWGNSNIGINDSQCGIFVNNIYTQKADLLTDIISSNDANAVELTPQNFYNSLWFKLGFTYYDLIPIKFIENDFKNRFYDLYYNNIDVLEYRKLAVKPFTTNSDIGISEAIGANVFGYDASTGGTALIGKPAFSLGYNNNQEIALEVSSAFMSATSIPVQISTPYYRIYTNLPIDNLNYQNDGNNLSCIGLGLRNYASSSFYYSYAMSYNATITKDITLTEIKTEIRNIDGVIARNLSDKSVVIYKISQQRTIGTPETPPQLELLQKISDELKENNKIETKENFFERLKLEQAEMEAEEGGRIGLDVYENIPIEGLPAYARSGYAPLESKYETKQDDMTTSVAEIRERERQRRGVDTRPVEEQEAIENFIYNLKLKLIQNLVRNTAVPTELIKKGGKPKPKDLNDGLRDIASGLAQYFYRNRGVLRDVENKLYSEGESAMNSPFIQRFIKDIRGFMVNVDGELVRGTTPNVGGTFEIDELGARVLLDKINNSINEKSGGKLSLNTQLIPLVSQLFQDSQNIQLNMGDYAFDPLRVRYKLGRKIMEENLLSDPLPQFLKDKFKIKDKDIKRIAINKNVRNVGDLYRLAQKQTDPELRYRTLSRLVERLRNMGVKIPTRVQLEVFGLKRKEPSGITDLDKALEKDASVFRESMREGKRNIKQIRKEEARRDDPSISSREFGRKYRAETTGKERRNIQYKIRKENEKRRADLEKSRMSLEDPQQKTQSI